MSTFQIFATGINACAVIICAGMIFRLIAHMKNRKAKTLFGIILGIQILTQLLVFYTYQFNAAIRLQNAIWICLLISCIGQMLLNISILEIFSVMDHRLTSRRIRVAYGIVITIIFVCSVPLLLYLILDESFQSMGTFANFLGMIAIVITIIIDVIQGLYLALTIFKKRKILKAFRALAITILFIFIQALIDWTAVAVKLIDISLPMSEESSLSRNLRQIAVGLGSTHFAISVHIFVQVKMLFVAGFISDVNKKELQQMPISIKKTSSEDPTEKFELKTVTRTELIRN